jgi:hypothetical protein
MFRAPKSNRSGDEAVPRSPYDASVIWLRSADCEEVRAKLCIHNSEKAPKKIFDPQSPAFPGFVRKLSFFLKNPVDWVRVVGL